MLDDVKEKEDNYKLAEPASLNSNNQYNTHGSIGLIAWL
jgi:hypothetical protein